MTETLAHQRTEAPRSAGTAARVTAPRPAAEDPRSRLLAGLPVTERRRALAGIDTAVLEGGAGPPIVLLHGPGESAVKWLRIIPPLVETHRVIAPDLPGHGSSGGADGPLDADHVLAWLDALIDATCASPPVLMGQVIGGAIGARYAIRHPHRLRHLVLQDSLGLARFRPAPRFAMDMMRFMARPTERSYTRFMRQCSYDLDGLREDMGERWDPFVAYNVESTRGPGSKAIGRMMRAVGLPRLPEAELAGITTPTTLIWGREDRAIRLRVAEAASARYGWPLHVIDDCADDAPRDKPSEFLDALRDALGRD